MTASILTTTEALRLILDQVDYTKGACGLTEMVGACLDKQVIETCHQALAVDRTAAINADLRAALVLARKEIVHRLGGNERLIKSSATIFGIDAALAKAEGR